MTIYMNNVSELCNYCSGHGYSQSSTEDCTGCVHSDKAVICQHCFESKQFGEVVEKSITCDCRLEDERQFLANEKLEAEISSEDCGDMGYHG